MSIITGGGDGGSLSSGDPAGREGVVVEKKELLENFHGSNSFSSTTTSNGSTTQQPPPAKKKRNPPGNPDPSAEVVALSPNTLLARNRFVCEICNKGFQRDQNLQLHRRGHNLPWKLRQRNPNDVVRKRVYICPEPSCVHHHPARALGDLTGIKKHFCRKHGDKKWKCDKCSKKYAVHSDWKAHSKTCGTREYKCECGTIFSRRDSFITHRAFCDAIAEENNKTISSTTTTTLQGQISSLIPAASIINDENDEKFKHNNHLIKNPLTLNHHQSLNDNNNGMAAAGTTTTTGSLLFSTRSLNMMTTTNSSSAPLSSLNHQDQSNGPHFAGGFPGSGEPYLSATALLQKAAQMGATVGGGGGGGITASSAMAPSSYGSLDQYGTPPPPPFFNLNNGNSNNVGGIFSGLLFDHPQMNHDNSSNSFLKSMQQSMNDGNGNVVLHGGNSNGAGGDVLTVDFLGIGRSGNLHDQKQVLNFNNGGINGHPSNNIMQSLSQFHQHAGMEKHVWEL